MTKLVPPSRLSRLAYLLFTSAMHLISTLFLLSITMAFSLSHTPAQVAQSNENQAVSIKELRNAPAVVLLEGRSLTLSAFPWRDFMPSSPGYPNGSPLMVVIKVATSDKKPLPSGVLIDKAWVLFGDQMWKASDYKLGPTGRSERDWWLKCAETPVCEATARDGPKWGPGVFVDVVVRLTDREGHHHMLQARKQYIMRSD